MVIVDDRNFVMNALEEQSLNLFDYYDGHRLFSVKDFAQVSLKRRSEIVLVDTASLLSSPELVEACKTVMNTFSGVIFFHEAKNASAQKWVQDQASYLSKILNECSLPMSPLSWNMLSNQLQFFWTLLNEQRHLQKHMVEFSQELDQVLQAAEWESTRAKKIHEILVPKRSDEIKGVHFHSKYAAGDGGGGEFYDLHTSGNKVYQILMASESYLISSSLMGVLNNHKLRDFDSHAFLRDAQTDINAINNSKKKKARVDVLVLELDLSKLSLICKGTHKVEFFSRAKGLVKLEPGEDYQLEKGEKFIVFSQGFLFNWNESVRNQGIHAFLKEHTKLTATELMNELFFQIRKDQDQFLRKDAMVVIMEVNRHGMHQV